MSGEWFRDRSHRPRVLHLVRRNSLRRTFSIFTASHHRDCVREIENFRSAISHLKIFKSSPCHWRFAENNSKSVNSFTIHRSFIKIITFHATKLKRIRRIKWQKNVIKLQCFCLRKSTFMHWRLLRLSIESIHEHRAVAGDKIHRKSGRTPR